MTSPEKYDPPKESVEDYGHAVMRASLGAIPFGGTAAIEIFNRVIIPPIEKRRDEWRQMVGEKLNQMEAKGGIELERLANNEVFATTIMQASQIAIRNHHREKLEALRNAVVNAALPNPPDESKQLIFLNLIDSFTVWHIRILRLFQNPRLWFDSNNKLAPSFGISSSLSALLVAAYPEMEDQRALYDLIANELEAKGLFSGGSMHSMMSANGAFEKRTTSLGNQFLRFITDPAD